MKKELTAEDLQKIPFEIREQMLEALASLSKANTAQKKIDRTEKALVRFSVRKWQPYANKAAKSAINVVKKGSRTARVTKQEANRMVSLVDRTFKGIEKQYRSQYEKAIKEAYVTNKTDFVRRFEVKPVEKQLFFHHVVKNDQGGLSTAKKLVKSVKDISKVDPTLVATFTDLDELVYAHLAELSLISIGDHYPRDLKPRVVKAIQEGVFERGLNKEQATAYLEKELTKILGSSNLAVPAAIREAGQASVNAYFKGLAGTNFNFARNFGNTTALDEAGVERYVIVAILDNLTSDICQQMNGREFSVSVAVEHRDRVLAVEGVEELKQVAPWRKNLKDFGLKAGEKLTSDKTAGTLANAGLALPPYHFRCRSEVYPA